MDYFQTTAGIVQQMRQTYGCEVLVCGSQITLTPPPGAASDTDYLVLIPHDAALSSICDILVEAKFEWEGSTEHYQQVADNGFMSWRRKVSEQVEGGSIFEHTNFIMTKSEKFFRRHRLATAVCRDLNLRPKAARIMVFQAILYGHHYSEGGAVKADPHFEPEPVFRDPGPMEDIPF